MVGFRRLNDRIRGALEDRAAAYGRRNALRYIRPLTAGIYRQYPELRQRLRHAKETVFADLDTWVERASASLEANGCIVHHAATAADAVETVLRLVGSPVLKSKTNTGKEVGLPVAMTRAGIRYIETDLGDRIVQLAGSRPTHPLAPAIHISAREVLELFAREGAVDLEPSPESLVGFARQSLRGYLENVQWGITGANAIAADTGTIVLMENEGNIRAITSLAQVHVVVAGINKLVPRFEDAVTAVQAASRFGTGQAFGTYFSAISGPGAVGPTEVHVVLIDNGRRRAGREGFGEAFYCINCGSCHNHCPVYDAIGDGYGGKHLGGIGLVQAAFTHDLEEAARNGLSFCLSCGSCRDHCPAIIDTPGMINRLRGLLKPPQREPAIVRAGLGLLRRQRALELGAAAASCVYPVLKHLGGQARRIPAPARRSFLSAHGSTGQQAPRVDALFFAGCFINTCYPHLGTIAIELLQKRGLKAVAPRDQECCGMPFMASGMFDEARELASGNLRAFGAIPEAPVFTACATCTHVLRSYYRELFRGSSPELEERVARFSERVMDVTQLLLEAGVEREPGKDISVTYHDPCHLRSLGITSEPRRLIQGLDGVRYLEMEAPETCCGFGGTTGFVHPVLSDAIARQKVEGITATRAEAVVTACPGCVHHLSRALREAGAPARALHVLELLSGRLSG